MLSGQRQGPGKHVGAECFSCEESRERGTDDDDSAALFEACPRSIVMHVVPLPLRASVLSLDDNRLNLARSRRTYLLSLCSVRFCVVVELRSLDQGVVPAVCLATPSRSSGLANHKLLERHPAVAVPVPHAD
jgi:hypothetical protein